MCQTINTVFDKNYCPWVSCGEWCLTVCHFQHLLSLSLPPHLHVPACLQLVIPFFVPDCAFAPIKWCNSSPDDSFANISIKYSPCN